MRLGATGTWISRGFEVHDLIKCDMISDFCAPFDTWHVTYWKNAFSWEVTGGKHFCLEHITGNIYNFEGAFSQSFVCLFGSLYFG